MRGAHSFYLFKLKKLSTREYFFALKNFNRVILIHRNVYAEIYFARKRVDYTSHHSYNHHHGKETKGSKEDSKEGEEGKKAPLVVSLRKRSPFLESVFCLCDCCPLSDYHIAAAGRVRPKDSPWGVFCVIVLRTWPASSPVCSPRTNLPPF